MEESVVSVIIAARNAAATLEEQLDALAGQTYRGDWEIIVVDNGSSDGTVTAALSWQQKMERLRVISAPQRVGTGFCRNVGCSFAIGQRLLFCDADDVVAATWVETLTSGLDQFDVVGGTLDRDRLNNPVTRAARPGPGGGLRESFRFLPYASCANLGAHRRMLHRIGGFDETFTYGGDDIDLCWRVQLAGGHLGVAPEAVVAYRLRPTVGSTMRQLYRYGHSHTLLYRRYRNLGMPPASRAQFSPAGSWRLIAANAIPALWSPSAYMNVCGHLAFRAGRVTGSIQHRVRYL